MIGRREEPRRRWHGHHPAAFVVAYTFGLVGILAASGYAAVDLGVNPAWLVAAACAVIGFGALAVVQMMPREPDEDAP